MDDILRRIVELEKEVTDLFKPWYEQIADMKDAERYRALRHVLSGYGGGLVVNNVKSRGDAKAVRLYWQIGDTTSFESSQDGTLDELIDGLIKKLHKAE